MSKPLNNSPRSSFWLPVLMVSVMVWIIITGFEDFGSGYGYQFSFQFTVLKNCTNFIYFYFYFFL